MEISLLFNPVSLPVFLLFFLILLGKKNAKALLLFSFLAPAAAASCLFFYSGIQILPIYGSVNFIFDYGKANKYLCLALIIAWSLGNFYENPKKKLKEITLGSLYCASCVLSVLSYDPISFFLGIELAMLFASLLVIASGDPGDYLNFKEYLASHLISGSLILSGLSYLPNFFDPSSPLEKLAAADNLAPYLLCFGLLINVASFPFSAWLLNSYPKARGGSFLYLSNFTTKVAAAAIVKFLPGFFLLKFFGAATLLYSVYKILFEDDIKKFLCYADIAGLGIITGLVGYGITEKDSPLFYIAFSVISRNLLALPICRLEDSASIRYFSRSGRIWDRLTLFSLILGLGAIINFPIFPSFYLKKAISSEAASPINSLSLFFGTALIISIPFKKYFFGEKLKLAQRTRTGEISVIFIIFCAILLSISAPYPSRPGFFDILVQTSTPALAFFIPFFYEIPKFREGRSVDLISVIFSFLKPLDFTFLSGKLRFPDIKAFWPSYRQDSFTALSAVSFSLIILITVLVK